MPLAQLASAKRGSYEGDPGACPQEKNLKTWASSILEQKLECLNRTETSLNFGFLRGNFQRKVGGKFM